MKLTSILERNTGCVVNVFTRIKGYRCGECSMGHIVCGVGNETVNIGLSSSLDVVSFPAVNPIAGCGQLAISDGEIVD